ncbi:MAG: hypothetical protein R2747_03555 [Pyrinomonadaceae bacterium]
MKKIALLIAILGAVFLFGNLKKVYGQGDSSMVWTGTVDDVVEIEIRGRNAKTVTVSGREYRGGRARFSGRGSRRDTRAKVDKEDGRGKVRVVQQPRRSNNYTTIIRIEDSKGGADRYRIRVEWD